MLWEGAVAFMPPSSSDPQGFYVAMPEVDWHDLTPAGYGHWNNPHPHSQLTEEELRVLPRVVWVETPETRQRQSADAQYIRSDYATVELTAADLIPGENVPEGDARYTYYEIPERFVNSGGGHFEFADEEPDLSSFETLAGQANTRSHEAGESIRQSLGVQDEYNLLIQGGVSNG